MSEQELHAANCEHITSITGWPVETECVAPGRWWASSGNFAGRGPTEHLALMELLEAVQSQ